MECGRLSCLSKQTDVPSSMLLGRRLSSAHPLLPPSRRCVGDQFPRRISRLSPYPEFPLVFEAQTALQGRGRGGTSSAGAPGGTGTPGGFGLCRAAALRGDRWPELLLFNVLPPWHCPDRKWGREPMSKLCILSVTEKNS